MHPMTMLRRSTPHTARRHPTAAPLMLALMLGSGCRHHVQQATPPAGEEQARATAFGIEAGSITGPREEHRAAIATVRELGAGLVRDHLTMDQVEAPDGSLALPENVRANLVYTRDRQLRTLLVLGPGAGGSDAAGRERFARYCGFVAGEVGDLVMAYEIWPDANNASGWRPAPDAVAYAGLLEQCAAAIRAHHPDAVVVAGGTHGFDAAFVRAAAAAAPSVRGWGVKPLLGNAAPDAARLDPMIRAAGAQSVWLSRIGYATHPTGLDEWAHAAMIPLVYTTVLRSGASTGVWFRLGPDGERDFEEQRSGLLRRDGSRKPAFEAYRTMTRQLGGASFTNRVDLVRGLTVDVYTRSGGALPVVTLLHHAEGICQVEVSAPHAMVVDMMGAETLLVGDDGTILLDVGAQPLYLRTDEAPVLTVPAEPTLGMTREPVAMNGNSAARIELVNRPLAGGDGRLTSFRRIEPRWAGRPELDLMAATIPDGVYTRNPWSWSVRPRPALERRAHELAMHVAIKGQVAPFARLLQPIVVQPGATMMLEELAPDAAGRQRFRARVDLADAPSVPTVSATWAAPGLELDPPRVVFSGDLTTAPLEAIVTIAGEHAPDEFLPISTRIELPSGEIVAATQGLCFMTSPRAMTPLAMDGDLGDWPRHAPIRLERANQVAAELRPWGGTGDSAALVYTAWDDEFLYVAAEVMDDLVTGTQTGSEVYQNDGLEVYVGAEPATGARRYAPTDTQFGFMVEGDRAVAFQWTRRRAYHPTAPVAMHRNPAPTMTISGRPCAYILEGAFPLADLGIVPEAGRLIGFNVALNDDDSPDFSNPFGQEIQIIWNGRRGAFRDPSTFARLRLVEEK